MVEDFKTIIIHTPLDLYLAKSLTDEQRKAVGIDFEALEKSLYTLEELGVSKSRSKAEWKDVKRDKEEKYGTGETFADETHNSYPLTEGGQPSRERTMAAWRYINSKRNSGEYGDDGSHVKSKIKRFAKEHFGLELQDGEE